MPSPVRVLCTGDLHVGRFPSHVSASDRSLSVEAVWDRTVDLALAERVDAVVLTGDVADQDNKLFEALGPLRTGVARLAAAGVRTVAVSGNHDYDVLRRLADLVDADAFTLLGTMGTWTETTLEKEGAPALRLVGWSFPSRHVRTSPLETFPDLAPGPPTLGVVHGDLDQAESDYAPLPRAALVRPHVSGWLLGHIHRPAFDRSGGTTTLYPGSPQPLDPGETGPHGPWLVTVQPSGAVEAHHHPLASVRYDAVEVDLSDAENRDGVETAFTSVVDDHLDAVHAVQPDATHVVVDLRAIGRTTAFAAAAAVAEQIEGREIPGPHATATVRRVVVNARPAYDLEVVAQRNDPAGAVAQLVLDVERGDAPDLVAEATRSLRALDGATGLAPLRRDPRPTADPTVEARERLTAQGLRLLDSLLAQTAP